MSEVINYQIIFDMLAEITDEQTKETSCMITEYNREVEYLKDFIRENQDTECITFARA